MRNPSLETYGISSRGMVKGSQDEISHDTRTYTRSIEPYDANLCGSSRQEFLTNLPQEVRRNIYDRTEELDTS